MPIELSDEIREHVNGALAGGTPMIVASVSPKSVRALIEKPKSLTKRKVPTRESEKARIASRIVQTLSASRFSMTAAECSSAVAVSHGMKEAFSTGSQNHQPPQPSV